MKKPSLARMADHNAARQQLNARRVAQILRLQEQTKILYGRIDRAIQKLALTTFRGETVKLWSGTFELVDNWAAAAEHGDAVIHRVARFQRYEIKPVRIQPAGSPCAARLPTAGPATATR